MDKLRLSRKAQAPLSRFLQQHVRFHAESASNLLDVVDGGVLLSTFQHPNIRSVDASALCKLFLREFELKANPSHVCSENGY